LWLAVAANLGIVAEEQVAATLVPSAHGLWEPVATELVRGVVQQGAAALQVGNDGLRESVAAELELGVVREVTAALALQDVAWRNRDDEVVATHEELWVERQFPAAVDAERGAGGWSEERDSVATDLGRSVEIRSAGGIAGGRCGGRCSLTENSNQADRKKDG